MSDNIEFKLNDRKFPEHKDKNAIFIKCALYTVASVIGAGYVFANRRQLIAGTQKLSLKLLVFPLSSGLLLYNMTILEDLYEHEDKYPELYKNN